MPGTDAGALTDKIQKARDMLAADFDPLAEIRGIIPPDFIEAAEYNEKYLSDRRARRIFRGMEIFSDLPRYSRIILKKARDTNSEDWSDLVIIYLIGSGDEDAKNGAKILSSAPPEYPGLLYAIHNHSSVLAETLLQHSAASQVFQNEIDPQVRNELQKTLSELKEAIESLYQWENWTFHHKDGIIKKDPAVSETAFISDLTEKIFTDSFNSHHRALSLHIKLDPQYRMMVKGVLRQLLDFSKPVMVKSKDLDRTGEIFHAMAKLGMIGPLEDQEKDKDQEWEVESEIDEENPIWPVWSYLLYNVLGVTHQDGEVRFDKILKTFREIPKGLNDNFIRIVFAVFWRCYHDYMDLYDARDFNQELVKNFSADISEEMLKSPADWKIVKTGAKPSDKELPVTDLLSKEEKYMRSVISIFDPDGFDEERFDYTWDEARDRALDWHEKYARLITSPGTVSTEIFSFIKILEGSREIDSRELFLAIIPNLFSFEPNPDQLIHDPDNLSRSIKTVIEDMDDLSRDLSVKSKKIYKRQSKVAWDALSDELSLSSDGSGLFDRPATPPAPRPELSEPEPASYLPPIEEPARRTISLAETTELSGEEYEEPTLHSDEEMFLEQDSAYDFEPEEEPREDSGFTEEAAEEDYSDELIPLDLEEPSEFEAPEELQGEPETTEEAFPAEEEESESEDIQEESEEITDAAEPEEEQETVQEYAEAEEAPFSETAPEEEIPAIPSHPEEELQVEEAPEESEEITETAEPEEEQETVQEEAETKDEIPALAPEPVAAIEETIPAHISETEEETPVKTAVSMSEHQESRHEEDRDKHHKGEHFKLARPDFRHKGERPPLVNRGTSKPPFAIRTPAEQDNIEDPAEKLWGQIKSIFSIKDENEQNMASAIGKWLEDIKAEKYVRAYRGDTKLLYETLTGEGPVRENIISGLSEKMGMGPREQWQKERGAEFIARLDKAHYQMSVMKYLEMKALPRTDKGRIFIIKWLLKVLKHLKMTQQESLQFLQEYLKTLQKS